MNYFINLIICFIYIKLLFCTLCMNHSILELRKKFNEMIKEEHRAYQFGLPYYFSIDYFTHNETFKNKNINTILSENWYRCSQSRLKFNEDRYCFWEKMYNIWFNHRLITSFNDETHWWPFTLEQTNVLVNVFECLKLGQFSFWEYRKQVSDDYFLKNRLYI